MTERRRRVETERNSGGGNDKHVTFIIFTLAAAELAGNLNFMDNPCT